MTGLSDDALRALLRKDANAGWRAFIDQYTPLLIGLIRRAGLSDRDEVMEVYVLVCEKLSERGFERLRSQHARGSIGSWLAVVARNSVVDWVRSRKGRRRLFHAVRALPPSDQRVFEMYYWDERSPCEIAELLALAVRSKPAVALDDTDVGERAPAPDLDPETSARIAQLNARLEAALRRLPAEDAAIVRLKYIEGLSAGGVELALGLRGLTSARLREILARLRSALADLGVDAADVAYGQR